MKLFKKFGLFVALLLVSASLTAVSSDPSLAAGSPSNQTWTAVASSSDGTKLVAGTLEGLIWRSSNSGVDWVSTNATITGGFVISATNSGWWSSLDMSADGSKVVGVVKGGGVYTSTDSGATWTLRSQPGTREWTDVESSSDGTKLVASAQWNPYTTPPSNGAIWTSTDSGATWTDRTTSDFQNLILNGVSSSTDGSKLALVSNGSGIFTSTDSGATWTLSANTGGKDYRDITSSDDGQKLAAVAANQYGVNVSTSSDGGATWTHGTAVASQMFSVASDSTGTYLVSGAYYPDKGVATSSDSGQTWIDRNSGDYPSGSNMWGRVASSSSGAKLVAVPSSGCIMTSTDYGVSWVNRCNAEVAPGAPGKPVGTPGDNSVSLTWAKPATGTGPMSYNVTSSPAGASCVVTGRTAVCSGLTNGTSYTFTVTPTNPVGTGSGATSDPVIPNVPPTVTSISPVTGPSTGGTSITITGTLFANDATVKIGATACTSVVVVSDTQITCVTPAGTGVKDVSVTNGNGTIGTLSSAFTYYIVPTVTAVSPATGTTLGSTQITITGTNFASGATVTVGGVACTSVTLVSATSIRCNTPAGTIGAKDVVVTNTNGSSATRANAFTYVVFPTLTSVSPTVAATTGGTSITLTGTGFVSGATVTVGGVACTSVVVVSDTSITCTTAAGSAGAKAVVVTNTDTGTVTRANAVTLLVFPTLTGISPAAGTTLGGTPVTLTGTVFNASPSVTVGGAACTSVVVVSSTQITCLTPAGAAGAADVVVTNANLGTATRAGSYTYLLFPTISGVSPSASATVGGTTITITGTGFVSGLTVTVDGLPCANITVVSSTSITCETPANTTGTKAIVVTNPDTGTVTQADAVNYVVFPTLTGVAPTTGSTKGKTRITILGTGFNGSPAVTVGGVACTSVVVVSSTEINCLTPAGSSGAKDIVVTNTDGGTVTSAGGFTYKSAGSSNSGGNLASTGSDLLSPVVSGLLAITAGLLALVTRRRKIRTGIQRSRHRA